MTCPMSGPGAAIITCATSSLTLPVAIRPNTSSSCTPFGATRVWLAFCWELPSACFWAIACMASLSLPRFWMWLMWPVGFSTETHLGMLSAFQGSGWQQLCTRRLAAAAAVLVLLLEGGDIPKGWAALCCVRPQSPCTVQLTWQAVDDDVKPVVCILLGEVLSARGSPHKRSAHALSWTWMLRLVVHQPLTKHTFLHRSVQSLAGDLLTRL